MGEYADDAIRCEEDAVLEELINPCRPKSKMRMLLKILNPFIWCINMLNVSSWYFYESPMRNELYDFDSDIKYF